MRSSGVGAPAASKGVPESVQRAIQDTLPTPEAFTSTNGGQGNGVTVAPPNKYKGRYGATGATEDVARDSPIVEISLLLAEAVQHGLRCGGSGVRLSAQPLCCMLASMLAAAVCSLSADLPLFMLVAVDFCKPSLHWATALVMDALTLHACCAVQDHCILQDAQAQRAGGSLHQGGAGSQRTTPHWTAQGVRLANDAVYWSRVCPPVVMHSVHVMRVHAEVQ